MQTSLINVMQPLLNENGYKITPIMFKGKLIILPKEIEEQFGFKNLTNSITTSYGLKKERDYIVLDGPELKQLKELLDRMGNSHSVGKNANSLMVLTESGLYALAFRSNKEPLVEFRLWITEKVLPTIARTGGYCLNDTINIINRELDNLYKSTGDAFVKVKEVMTKAFDYKINGNVKQYFAILQNIVHQVSTGMDAAQIKMTRADSTKIHCGLQLNYRYGNDKKLSEKPLHVAKNFLKQKELLLEEEFAGIVIKRLSFALIKEGRLFSVDEFMNFVFDMAEAVSDIKVKELPHGSPIEATKHITKEVKEYNENKLIKDNGFHQYSLETKPLPLFDQFEPKLLTT